MTREPVDVTGSPDPVAAWHAADRSGRLVALATSGTTSSPRRVVRTTESWSVHFDAVSSLGGIGGGSYVWVPGPLIGTMNLYAAVHADAVGGAWSTQVEGATHAVLTPAVLSRSLAQGVALAGVHVIVAGDRLPQALVDRAVAAGVRVSHYYGAAELSFVAWGPGPDELAPFPGVDVECRDGVLWVRSPGVALGYAGAPGPLRTDDLGWASVGDRGVLEVVAGASVVRVTGRDDAVVTAGATVLLADVEAVLAPVARGELVAVPVPHADLGAVVAVVLTDDSDRDAVVAQARSVLTGASRPRLMAVVEELPLTAGGKVDRAALGRAVGEARGAGVSAGGIRVLSWRTAREDGRHG